MKRVLVILAIIALGALPATATDFKLYGSYWNTSDVDDTFGGGIGLGIPFGESGFGLHAAATYYQELSDEPLDNLFDDDEGFFEDESLEVLPIDVGLHYNFAPRGAFSPWIGAGASYFLIDTTREGIDVDDETGFHVSVGSNFGDPEGANFFAEAIYRSTEATLNRQRDDDIDIRDEVAIDLDGVAVNAGISWRW
jgi:hypothetical protein